MYLHLHDQTPAAEPGLGTAWRIAVRCSSCHRRCRSGAWHTHTHGSVSHNVKDRHVTWAGLIATRAGCGRIRLRRWRRKLHARRVGVASTEGAAREAFDAGDFRWAATLRPCGKSPTASTPAAGHLLEQLAYGAVCDLAHFFLTGAAELRDVNPRPGKSRRPRFSPADADQIFDVLAISINGPRAWDLDLAIDFHLHRADVNYRLTRNGVLIHRKLPADPATVNATVTGGRRSAGAVALGDTVPPGFEVFGDRTVRHS